MYFQGLVIAIATFLTIGLFHPIVIKAEYYWGKDAGGCLLLRVLDSAWHPSCPKACCPPSWA